MCPCAQQEVQQKSPFFYTQQPPRMSPIPNYRPVASPLAEFLDVAGPGLLRPPCANIWPHVCEGGQELTRGTEETRSGMVLQPLVGEPVTLKVYFFFPCICAHKKLRLGSSHLARPLNSVETANAVEDRQSLVPPNVHATRLAASSILFLRFLLRFAFCSVSSAGAPPGG